MRHAVGSSREPDAIAAATEAVDLALAGLDGAAPTIACCFVTPHHGAAVEDVVETLLDKADPPHVVGCTAENLIAGPREIAGEPGVTIWFGHWPDADVRSFHLEVEDGAADGQLTGWPSDLPDAQPGQAFLFFADPFTSPMDELLEHCNRTWPGAPAFGGLASGGWTPGMNRMIVNSTIYDRGIAAVAIGGGVRVEPLVSQGCRPIGSPFVITKSERNLLLQLGGKPALEQLKGVFAELTAEDQVLAQTALHVGQVVDERQDGFGRGDFLVRNVMGVDPETGAVAIGDVIRPGRTIQFHVRDAATAHADLRARLSARRAAGDLPDGSGLLFVSCNGRGHHLFGKPDQDSGAVGETLGDVPSGGFFAAGEIGPVGARNYLHGFTASLALFTPG